MTNLLIIVSSANNRVSSFKDFTTARDSLMLYICIDNASRAGSITKYDIKGVQKIFISFISVGKRWKIIVECVGPKGPKSPLAVQKDILM